jgi:hypothetical protein
MPVRTSIFFQFELKCSTQPCSSLTVDSTKDVSSAFERAFGKRKVQDVGAQFLHYSDLEPSYGTGQTIKTPVVLLLEREKQDTQRRAGAITVSTSELVEPPVLHELDGSDAESDEPLAKKYAKPGRPVSRSRKKHNKGDDSAPPLPTKHRSKAKKTLDGPANEATNYMKKTMGRRRKVTTDAGPPSPTTACGGVNLGGGSKVQVLQEKKARTNVPRKRKERVKALLDASAKDENDHEPPRKKSRRADPPAERYAVLFSPPSSSLGYVFWC